MNANHCGCRRRRCSPPSTSAPPPAGSSSAGSPATRCGEGRAGDRAPVPQRCGGARRRPPLGLRRPVRRGPHRPRCRRPRRPRSAARRIASIGIDTWAVDYGLVNDAGELIAQPFSYRDDRSRAAVAPRAPETGPGPALRHHGAAVPAVQHDLPARHRAGPGRAAGAAHPGPDRVPADRPAPHRGHQRLHHRAVRRRRGGVGHRVPHRPGPAQGPVPAADPARRNRRHPAARASRHGPGCPRATKVVAVGSHDTASAVAAVPAGAAATRRTSPTSPPAPGPWSASN